MLSKKQKKGHNKRHKCSACEKVRYEKFMTPALYPDGDQQKTRFGHKIWFCKDNKECLIEKTKYFTY